MNTSLLARISFITIALVLAVTPLLASAATCPNLYRNLSFGSRGQDVVELQNFLIEQGHLGAGNNTGNFRALTEAAVKKFQCRENIVCSGTPWTTGYGAVGPRTRAKIASMCGTTNPPPITQPPPTTPNPPPTPPSPPPTPTPVPPPPVPVSCTPLQPQTQTLSCPTGQTGLITQTRTSSCPGPVWGGWTTTSSTCETPITGYNEPHRPAYHFTSQKNFAGDPHLVFYQGEYHLFYQYTDYTVGGGGWGHAVSTDLLHWQPLPVAFKDRVDASNNGDIIFSGSVVVDVNNTSGLCTGADCLVAIYTSHLKRPSGTDEEYQDLAYSNDRGRTWQQYNANPALRIGQSVFRDPKVFWYAPQQKWVMVVALSDQYKVQFYQSTNLKDWTYLSEFRSTDNTAVNWHIWEVPDLFEVPIEGSPGQTRWVLSFSAGQAQGPQFGGMQYVVGQFNGTTFVADNPSQVPQIFDYGKDFYSGIVFNNLATVDSRPIMMGWVDDVAYLFSVPTSPWRGGHSLPREISLKHGRDGLHIIQRPYRNLSILRDQYTTDPADIGHSISGKALEIELFIDPANAQQAGIKIFKSATEEVVVGFDAASQSVYLDRRRSGTNSFSAQFPSIERAPVSLYNGTLTLRIFIDNSIIEVFASDGERVITDYVFPSGSAVYAETFSTGGNATMNFQAWEMKSIWR